jgi:hypothetical protein
LYTSGYAHRSIALQGIQDSTTVHMYRRVFCCTYGWDIMHMLKDTAGQVFKLHLCIHTNQYTGICGKVCVCAAHVSKVILRPAFVASCSSAVRLTICAAQFQELVFATVYS